MKNESAAAYEAKARLCRRLVRSLPANDPNRLALLRLAAEYGAKAAMIHYPELPCDRFAVPLPPSLPPVAKVGDVVQNETRPSFRNPSPYSPVRQGEAFLIYWSGLAATCPFPRTYIPPANNRNSRGAEQSFNRSRHVRYGRRCRHEVAPLFQIGLHFR